MEARQLRQMSEDEYLALDGDGETRWEYVNGEAFECMAARAEHNLAVANVLRALGNALAKGPCVVLASQQKVATRATRAFHYPDVTVVCGPLERHPKDENVVTNPSLLVEVLSPTTADYDRGAKFDHYRTLPSLVEILYVSVEARTVEHRRREAGGAWTQRWYSTGEVPLASASASLLVEELFEKLDLATA